MHKHGRGRFFAGPGIRTIFAACATSAQGEFFEKEDQDQADDHNADADEEDIVDAGRQADFNRVD